ncbi:MAG: hypothetical protein J0I40_10825, partial [Cellulomonas sp.]|nr:hypothetical protein [Cellulomonas sp.]
MKAAEALEQVQLCANVIAALNELLTERCRAYEELERKGKIPQGSPYLIDAREVLQVLNAGADMGIAIHAT